MPVGIKVDAVSRTLFLHDIAWYILKGSEGTYDEFMYLILKLVFEELQARAVSDE